MAIKAQTKITIISGNVKIKIPTIKAIPNSSTFYMDIEYLDGKEEKRAAEFKSLLTKKDVIILTFVMNRRIKRFVFSYNLIHQKKNRLNTFIP